MKKLLICLLCVAMLVTVVACGEDEPAATQPDTTATAAPTEGDTTTTPDANASADGTTSTTQKDSDTKTTSGTKVPQVSDNSVDFEDFWGDETTTTTTKKGDTTKKTSTTKKPTTTTTKKPTTVKSTTIDKVTLPAVGTDVDGRGRIAVSSVELKKGVMTLKIRNNTDKQTQKWITEETDYITYACYDKDGKELKGKDAVYGYFYLGCLEAGEEVEFKVTLPEGTVKVALTGTKIVYWTPWS